MVGGVGGRTYYIARAWARRILLRRAQRPPALGLRSRPTPHIVAKRYAIAPWYRRQAVALGTTSAYAGTFSSEGGHSRVWRMRSRGAMFPLGIRAAAGRENNTLGTVRHLCKNSCSVDEIERTISPNLATENPPV